MKRKLNDSVTAEEIEICKLFEFDLLRFANGNCTTNEIKERFLKNSKGRKLTVTEFDKIYTEYRKLLLIENNKKLRRIRI